MVQLISMFLTFKYQPFTLFSNALYGFSYLKESTQCHNGDMNILICMFLNFDMQVFPNFNLSSRLRPY